MAAALLDRPEQIRDPRQLRPEDYSDPQLAVVYRAGKTSPPLNNRRTY